MPAAGLLASHLPAEGRPRTIRSSGTFAKSAPLVPAVLGSPRILVGFAATKEMELACALDDGLTDRVPDEVRSGAVIGECRVEAGQISVGAPAMTEPIIDAGNVSPEAECI